MAMAVREQAAATSHMAQQMVNKNGNGNGNKHGNGLRDKFMRFVEFHKANPPSFQGTYDPNVADEWIKEIEKIFSILTCTKEPKVSFVAFMLKTDVEFW